ncbi:MAG: hydroxyacid dehydrogenase [bacterium]|nr:hydroxyacid dehydrogenase [bacterium]
MSTKPKVLLAMHKKWGEQIFKKEDLEYFKTFVDVNEVSSLPEMVNEAFIKENIKGIDICITCWGTPQFSKEILDNADRLKLIAHSAGTVKPIVTDYVWEKGIRVTSAAPAIAIAVAEMTLGLMIISLRRIFQFNELTHKGLWKTDEEISKTKSLYGVTIGIVGASHVGRNVIRLLKNFQVDILLYDPYVSQEEAEKLGVKLASLEELMSSSDVISLHAPSIPETYHMINRENIKFLKPGAILINTARGSLIDESALIERLAKGDIFVCLDVTDPEPPDISSPLRKLPNVILTPHIAGGNSVTDRWRQGRYIIEQIYKFITQGIMDYEVTKEMLPRIA